MTDLNQLEAQKTSLLSLVQTWPVARLNFRRDPACWSASEVFDHLVKTEERIVEAASKGLPAPHRIGVTDRARTIFLRKVFESERKVKVPASATVVLPDDAPEMSAILGRWQVVRSDLASFHSQLSPQQMRQGIFRHPVGGWMALPDVMDFFFVHMLHHTYQLTRLSVESQNL